MDMDKKIMSFIEKTGILLTAVFAGYVQQSDYRQAVRSMEDSAKFQARCKNYFF